MRFLQVVGTKGKGSTSTYIANILTAAGYKTGLFVSPHIQVENERISIDGKNIPDDVLARYMKKTTVSGYFRKFFQVAIMWFHEQNVDVAVMETGMGGRYDPATELDVMQLVITRIGMDHMNILGDTIQKIALEKIAAVRMKGDVISAPQVPEVSTLIKTTTYLRKASLKEVLPEDIKINEDRSFSYMGISNVMLKNPTSLQYVNASVAIASAMGLRRRGFNITGDAIKEALEDTFLLGRQQYLEKENVLVDGAHNVDSLKFLHDTLKNVYGGKRKVLVCAALKDKDVTYFNEMAKDQFEKVFVSQMEYERCFKNTELEAIFDDEVETVLCNDTEDAYRKAKEYIGDQDVMVVFAGSIDQAGEALDMLTK